MLDRAYSLIHIKSIDAEQRVIQGWATTPTTDRGGDIVEPMGVRFKNPLPLILHHQHTHPVGEVTFKKATAQGIPFEARIPKVVEAGIVKDRTDEAWHSAKYGLLKGVSIGYTPIESEPNRKGGNHLKQIEVYELSMVTVPMNAETTITAIKSLDAPFLAASGTRNSVRSSISPGVSGLRKDATMTISEQVTATKADLQTKSVRLEELINKKRDEGGLEAAEVTEIGSLKTAVKSLTEDLDDLTTLEAAQSTKAASLTFRSPEARRIHTTHSEIPKVEVKALPKGTGFTRYAMAVAAGRGSYSDTLAYAKQWEGQTPEVVHHIKAMFGKAVEGTTVENSPAWGHQLVYQNNLVSEFIELLRARTIMDRLTGLRRVPFNVRMVSQTDGSTVNWVGESAVKPVSDLGFDEVSIGQHKIAGIVVLSQELVRLSAPNAEEAVRRDLVDQIVRFMDQQFIDPTVTATTSRPASITQGVTSPAASGTTAEDLYFDMNLALATFDSVDQSTESIVILMPPALARGIGTLRNALGQFEFSGVNMNGGTLMGFPVIVSSSVPSGTIVIVAANEIFVADDGRVDLDASNQATLDMSGGASPTVSLWQRNLIGIRAERFVTWKKRRAESVAIIDTASYGPSAPAS